MEHRQHVARHPDSPSHLTEFARLCDDVHEPASSFSWAKFFKKTKGETGVVASMLSTSSCAPGPSDGLQGTGIIRSETVEISDSSSSEFFADQNKSSSSNASDDGRGSRPRESEMYRRSFTNVLRRISTILDKRLSTSNAYKDSDFKQYWMPDEDCKECYDCGDRFTTFRRRHHCRVCGQIFCGRCCNQEIPGKIIGCSGDLRVCKYCCKVVLSYLQSADVMADSSTSDLRCLQEDLQNKLSLLDNHSDSSTYEFGSRPTVKRKNSLGFREQSLSRTRTASSIDVPICPRTVDLERNTSELRLLTKDSAQLRELWQLIQNPISGIQFHNHRHRLTTYPSCVVGSELVDWLISEDKACSRLQAVAICQALVDSRYLEPVIHQEKVFLDEYALYRAGPLGIQETSRAKTTVFEQPEYQEGQEPTWVKEINQDAYGTGHDTAVIVAELWDDQQVKDEYEELAPAAVSPKGGFQRIHSSNSMFYVTLDADENTVSLNRVQETEPIEAPDSVLEHKDTDGDVSVLVENSLQSVSTDSSRASISDDLLKGALVGNLAPGQDVVEDSSVPIGWHSVLGLRQDNGEKLAYERLSIAYEQHEQALLCQLLSSYGLMQSWSEVILPIVRKVAETVRPDERHDSDDMDIRQYIQFKKIPGGKRSECTIVNGVVFTKNISHKKMKNNIMNPTILLVRAPIVYQRQENKLLSLEPAVLQEHNYLKNVVAKIASFKPNIVLVEKTVSRVAQDFLLDIDITLILNVKPAVLERVARLTQGDIVSSIDAQITKPNFGMCHNFRLASYTLTNGCTKTLMFFDGCAQHLGCTIMLRGAGNAELAKVKRIAQFMTYVYYNWRLERSFLMDEFALPPPLPEEKPFVILDEGNCLFPSQPGPDAASAAVESKEGVGSGASGLFGSLCLSPRNVTAWNSGDAASQSRKTAAAAAKMSARPLVNGEDNGPASLSSAEVERSSKERRCASQAIDDHSDPLRSYQKNEDDSVFLARQDSQMHVSSLPLANSFKKALDDTVLCASPNSKFGVPFLESEAGRKCDLRSFFATEVYWSEQFSRPKRPSAQQQQDLGADGGRRSSGTAVGMGSSTGLADCLVSDRIRIRPVHPFTTLKFVVPATDTVIQDSLADYRAQGGCIAAFSPQEMEKKSVSAAAANGITNRDSIDSTTAYNTSYWVDALDPFNHQRLSVLFCSYSYVSFNAPSFCVSPWVVNMQFYGCNDIPLGGFLEKYCFRTTYVCPSETCETPMTEHVRRFVHDNGCVHILLRKMEHPIKRWPDAISMWSWCRKCKQVTNVVPMSLDTWSLSFAKYLELRFHSGLYLRRGAADGCTHSLHEDHFQYFAYKQIVTAFKYGPIVLREIALPQNVIVCNDVLSVDPLIEDIKNLSVKLHHHDFILYNGRGHGVFGAILERLFTLRSECPGTVYEQMAADLLNQLQVEKNTFRGKIEDIQIKLTSPTVECVSVSDAKTVVDVSLKVAKEHLWRISDCVVNLKRLIAETVACWDVRLLDIMQQRKKDEKAVKPGLGNIKTISASIGSQPGSSVLETMSPKYAEPSPNPLDGSLLSSPAISRLPPNTADDARFADSCRVPPAAVNAGSSAERHLAVADEVKDLEMSGVMPPEPIGVSSEVNVFGFCTTSPQHSASGLNADFLVASSGSSADQNDASYSRAEGSTKESVAIVETPRCASLRVTLMDASFDSTAVTSFDQSQAVADLLESRAESVRSDGSEFRTLLDNKLKLTLSGRPDEDYVDVSSGKAEKKASGTVKNMISQLLSTSTSASLQNPFGPTEHYLLPRCEKVPVVVYEDEPSSIIAYALSSPDYELSMQELRLAMAGQQQQKNSHNSSPILKRKSATRDSSSSSSGQLADGVLASAVDNVQGTPRRTVGSVLSLFRGCDRQDRGGLPWPGRLSAFDSVHYTAQVAEKQNTSAADHEDLGDRESGGGGGGGGVLSSSGQDSSDRDKSNKAATKTPNTHVEVQFTDGTAKFYCLVYFAERFYKLRRLIFPDGEEAYVRSLSRCLDWMAKGGKSGCTFRKTHDDRFVIKQMTRLEAQSFLEFAPHYVDYVTRACMEQRPTVLTKIVGGYRIVYRNTQTNATSKMDLLVMENLFYGRCISQKFDLKGSIRNRMVNTAGKLGGDVVLLDENLLKMTCDRPLYVRPHSKTIVTLAINNDTQFLAQHLVMDYSLLVGMDDDRRELVIGIIDYIRTFTWDKKLETFVKSSGFLGGQGKMPTVVSPELYRNRFCEAMDGYFLGVPDRWSNLGIGVEC